jgi:hypothetical protein
MNIFKEAKAKGATASPKPQKEEVIVNDSRFHLNLTRLAELNRQIDELTAEQALIVGEVKERCIREFIDLYKRNGKFPGSFIIRGTSKAAKLKPTSLMFIATDKYLKIGEERHLELQSTYGTEISNEKTTYIMNTELIEKYGEIISELISKCKAIPDDDKRKLIGASTSYEVKKGTVNEAIERFPDHDLTLLIDDVKPIYQMKNVKIDE